MTAELIIALSGVLLAGGIGFTLGLYAGYTAGLHDAESSKDDFRKIRQGSRS